MLKQINWVDILAVILLFRIGYIAFKKGFVQEIFKFLGTLFALYFSFRFSLFFTELFRDKLSLNINAESLPALLIFLILAFVGYAVFVLLGRLAGKVFKLDAVDTFNHWAGLIVGLFRGLLFTSLILFMLVVSGNGYFKRSIKGSATGRQMFSVAPVTYRWIWESVVSKFAANEKFNPMLASIEEGIKSK